MTRLLITGRVFTADRDRPWAEAVGIEDDRIVFVGSSHDAPFAAGRGVTHLDAGEGVVLPGFVDAHSHLLPTGASLLKAQLQSARDVGEIGARLRAWAAANPDAPRVLGAGWTYSALPDGRPTAAMLDRFVAERPVYLEANDLHSSWVNSAALAELGITSDTVDPVGGRIVRDAAGQATGHLLENASMELVWPLLGRVDDATRDRHLATVIDAYLESGVTTAVDMALGEHDRAVIARAEASGRLPLRVVAHWLVRRTGDPATELEQVEHAARVAARHRSDRFRVVGIKLIIDGTIDGCTAAMIDPYADGAVADPIWDDGSLRPVVHRAHELGLQIAIHAIGDRAVRSAIDALELAIASRPRSDHRHRIEHLEYVAEGDVPRLGALGIVASMQPVHADPAIMDNWVAVLGDRRVERGFAWPEYPASGAVLAFSTDTPTAPYQPLPNMYIATTRRSPSSPGLAAHRPDFALPMQDAFRAASFDAAWASAVDREAGSIRVGLSADVVVLDRDPFRLGPTSLLEARPLVTVSAGQIVHDARPAAPGPAWPQGWITSRTYARYV